MQKLLVAIFGLLIGLSTLYANSKSSAATVTDTTRPHIKAFEENNDGSVYTGMYEILKGLQPVSFVGVLPSFKGWNRPYPLLEGEGKKGYLLEANIDQSFTLLQGRNQSSDFYQRARVAFRYAPAFRMTLDSSLPIVPITQRVGLDVSYALWDNYTNRANIRQKSTYYAEDTSWVNKTETFKVLHLLFHAMHYSNGQAPGVYYRLTPVKRNDYKKGDFSTNFLSLMAVYSVYMKDHRLYSAGLGYRIDGGIGDALSYNPEQEQRFGKHRILGLLQLRGNPRSFGKGIPWTDLATGKQYELRNKISQRTRIEAEYILGSLANYDPVHKNRLGIHFYYELEFAKARTTGFVLHLYHGRDYMNVRYDDVVTGGSLGFTFTLAKYKPPRQKSYEFIKTERPSTYDPVKRRNVLQ